MALRKKLHNELVELKGNIRVFCRVRPVIKEDGGGRNAENVITFDEDDDAILNVFSKGSNKPFEMDKVFKPQSTQEQVKNYSKVYFVFESASLGKLKFTKSCWKLQADDQFVKMVQCYTILANCLRSIHTEYLGLVCTAFGNLRKRSCFVWSNLNIRLQ